MVSATILTPAWKGQRRYSLTLPTRYFAFLAILFLIGLFMLSNSSPRTQRSSRIQYDFRRRSTTLAQPERLKAVQREFMHAWTGYKDHAWMSDSLMSLSGQRNNHLCGWSATLVDSLDTLWIMDMKDEFEKALQAVVTIDFVESAAICEVNVFESTIRYMGGLLAAYDLSQDVRLLPKITQLGDMLNTAFDTPSGMSCGRCMLPHNPTRYIPAMDVPLADLGSFYLELGRLWQITKDQKYLRTLNRITEVFAHTQMQSTIPGLWPERLNATLCHDGGIDSFSNSFFDYSLGGLSDSAYEYLVKAHFMLGGVTTTYSRMWNLAAVPLRKLMIFRAQLPPTSSLVSNDILFSGILRRESRHGKILLEPRAQHLGCFAGGMFALAGRIFHNPSDIQTGAALTDGCVWAYNATVTGIMPETFSLLACDDVTSGKQCVFNEAALVHARLNSSLCYSDSCESLPAGFVNSIDRQYALRPEAVESVFVLWRITGDETWRDKGWTMFQHIIEQTRTSYGHATISDATMLMSQMRYVKGKLVLVEKAELKDEMESFWLAETLKYFWLLFSDPDVINLDEWVLNTEAHPLKLIEDHRAKF